MSSTGRPKDPPSFAIGNFVAPALPWDGLPYRLDPGFAFFEPKTFGDPRALNYHLGLATDAAAGAVNAAGQLAALNWRTGAGTTHNLKRAAWSSIDQAWWAFGDGGNDFLESSYNWGRSWNDEQANLAGGHVLIGVAVNPSGVIAIITNTVRVYKGTRTAYATTGFVDHNNMLNAIPAAGNVVWDDVNSVFIAVYRTGAVGHIDYTANPSTAWTAGTAPAAWATYVGTKAPDLAFANGYAIAAYLDTAAQTLNIMRSTDGGATWTNVQVTLQASAANLGVNSIMTRPTYDDANGAWFVAVSSTADAKTEIFKSIDNGATWSSVYYDALILHDLQAMGSLLVGLTSDHRVVFTCDGAGSWYGSEILDGAAVQMWLATGGGGYLTVNSTDKSSYLSHRFGFPFADVVG